MVTTMISEPIPPAKMVTPTGIQKEDWAMIIGTTPTAVVAVVRKMGTFLVSRMSSHKALRRFGDLRLLRPLMQGVSEGKLRVKFAIEMLALVCLIIAAARPQFGSKLETVKKEGIEVMVCLDISNSMLAEDIRDTASRNCCRDTHADYLRESLSPCEDIDSVVAGNG